MNTDLENDKRYAEYLKSEQWKRIAYKRLQIDNFRCCACGTAGSMTNPIEVHHLSYAHLYHEEDRIYEDLVSVCRACHKQTHRLMERITSPSGRRGWKNNPRIPQYHVFNIDGTNEIKEGSI